MRRGIRGQVEDAFRQGQVFGIFIVLLGAC